MTISKKLNRWEYDGDGAQTVFQYKNKIFASSDLLVYLGGVLQTETTHYSVSGVGVEAGGDVTFVAAPVAGTANVLIVRAVPETQGTDLPIAGIFPAESVESMADKNTVLIQQASDKIARALVVSDSDPDAFGAMPLLSTFFGKYLALDGDGIPTPGVSLADQSVTYTTKKLDGDNIQTKFNLGAAPASAEATDVFISGVRQVPGDDYTVTGSDLDFISAPPSGTKNIFVVFSQSFAGVPSDGSVTAAKFATLNAANSIVALAALGAASLAEANIFAKTQSWSKGADLTSAATITPGSDGNYFDIAGSSGPIADIAGSQPKGTVLKFHFDNAPSITHHATALILPGGANIQVAAGDEVEFVEYDGAGNWRCTNYTRASGVPIVNGSFAAYQDQQAQGVAGSTHAAGAWRTMVVNVKVSDIGGIGSLSSNQPGLAAGTYRVHAVSPQMLDGGRARLRLRNVTDSATLVTGLNYEGGTTAAGIESIALMLEGVFVIAASKALELQIYPNTQSAVAPDAHNVSGELERYTSIVFEKIA